MTTHIRRAGTAIIIIAVSGSMTVFAQTRDSFVFCGVLGLWLMANDFSVP